MGQLSWDCNGSPIPKEPFGGWALQKKKKKSVIQIYVFTFENEFPEDFSLFEPWKQ